MRIDVFLKVSRLIKQREAAKKACDQGMVRLDGRTAKPGSDLQPGARLTIEWPSRRLEVEVLETPSGNISKMRSLSLYRLLNETDLSSDEEDRLSFDTDASNDADRPPTPTDGLTLPPS